MKIFARLILVHCLIALASVAHANVSIVTGQIKDAQGNPVNGTLVMRLPIPAQDPTTQSAIAPVPVTFSLVNGNVTGGAPLYDLATIQPGKLWYSARAYDTTGALVFYGNYYVTGATFNIGAATPTVVTTSNISFAQIPTGGGGSTSGFGQIIDVTTKGVLNDTVILNDGAMTAGSNILTSSTACNPSKDIAKLIDVQYAGNVWASGGTVMSLASTINSCSGSSFVLKDQAISTTAGQVQQVYIANNGTGYNTGDTGTFGNGATYRVVTQFSGNVFFVVVTNPSSGNTTGIKTTTNGGAQPGTGTGLTINVTSVSGGSKVVYGTDNTTALASLISTSPTNSECYFPPGNYLYHRNGGTINGGLNLDGTGGCRTISGQDMWNSVIYEVGPQIDSNGHPILNTDTTVFNLLASGYVFRNIGISGTNWNGTPLNNGGNGAHGIVGYGSGSFGGNAANILADSIRIDSIWGGGYQVINGPDFTIVNSRLWYNGEDALNFGSYRGIISNNNIQHNGSACMENDSSYQTIVGNTCQYNSTGIVLGGGGALDPARGNVITGNDISHNGSSGIGTNNSSHNVISNNSISQNDGFGINSISGGWLSVSDAVCAGGTSLTSATANFQSQYAGLDIAVFGCGINGATLYTTIQSVTNSTTVVLANAESTAGSGKLILYNAYLPQRNQITGNTVTSNGCNQFTTPTLCNIQWPVNNGTSSGAPDGIYIATFNNTVQNNVVQDGGIPGFTQNIGIYSFAGDSNIFLRNTTKNHNGGDFNCSGSTNNVLDDPLLNNDKLSVNGGCTFFPTTVGASAFQATPSTFALIPACASSLEGNTRAVTDSTTNIWGATITGTGTNHVLAYCDGTNWTVTGK